MRAALVLVVVALVAPSVAAEFGPESADGFPVDVLGRVQYPPIEPVVYDCAVPGCERVAEAYAAPLNKVGPITIYPYYPLLTAEVRRLADAHPDLVKLTSGGKSTAGLDLWLLEIADFARVDSGEGGPLEARERLWIDGGTHSNEYSGVYFTLEVAQFLLEEYATNDTARWIVENRHTFVMPLVNPDGSHVFGRLNAKAVNVNRNYPVGWAGLDEDPVFNNPGPSAASEVETQAVMALWDRIRPDYVASIHCCGNLWLYPYGIEGIDPPDNATFARACVEAFPDVGDACGPIWSTIYPASGSSVDTAYELYGAFAWGFEMSGRGRIAVWGQPVTDQDVRVQEKESWGGVMHAFLHVEKYGGHPNVVAVEGDAATLRITVENDGWGPLTNASLSAFLGGPSALSSYRAELPPLAPGERATVEVPGAFRAGDLDVQVDYQKRLMAAPRGTLHATVPLVAEGDRLVGVLGEASLGASAGAAPVPAAGMLAALSAVGAGVLMRRR